MDNDMHNRNDKMSYQISICIFQGFEYIRGECNW